MTPRVTIPVNSRRASSNWARRQNPESKCGPRHGATHVEFRLGSAIRTHTVWLARPWRETNAECRGRAALTPVTEAVFHGGD